MKKLLVCDLDNTLYDWVRYFVAAFYAMVDEVVNVTGCDREVLLDDFRKVHRRNHDSEHPFSLLDTNTVRNLYPRRSRAEIAKELDSAFYAFNSSRKRNLVLYPGVRETLDVLRNEGVVLVAHTESKLYAVVDRLSRLDLTRYFSHIYCRERPDSLHPTNRGEWASIREFPMWKVVELSHHQRKPSEEVLLEICAKEGISPPATAYVGDSMSRDILMAKRAGVAAIWAKYGAHLDSADYEKLVRVSHWTEGDIKRERALAREASVIVPDAIAEKSFAEVLAIIGDREASPTTAYGSAKVG